jgi:hypothetical protein
VYKLAEAWPFSRLEWKLVGNLHLAKEGLQTFLIEHPLWVNRYLTLLGEIEERLFLLVSGVLAGLEVLPEIVGAT